MPQRLITKQCQEKCTIRRAWQFIQRNMLVRRALARHSELLAPGHYEIRDRFAMKIGEPVPEAFLSTRPSLVRAEPRLKDRLKETIYRAQRMTVARNRTTDLAITTGTLLYVTRNGQVKVFSPAEGKVTTILLSPSEFSAVVTRTRLQLERLPAPRILQLIPERRAIVEEYVAGRSPQLEEAVEAAAEWIFDTYRNHLAEALSEPLMRTISVRELMAGAEKIEEFTAVAEAVRVGLTINSETILPLIPSHGDICLKNIIRATGRTLLVDWEYAGHYTPFYDILNWMFVEALDNNDLRHLRKYLAGGYDSPFEEIAALTHLPFNRDLRKDYISIYVLERLSGHYASTAPRERRKAAAAHAEILARVD